MSGAGPPGKGPTGAEHEWTSAFLGIDTRAAAGAAGDLAKGIGEGVAEGVTGLITSTVHMAEGAAAGAYGLATDPAARKRAGRAIGHAAGAVSAFTGTVATNPKEAASQAGQAIGRGAETVVHTAKAVVHGVAAGYKDAAAHGHAAEFVGNAIGQGGVLAAGMLIPGVGEGEGAAVAAEGASTVGRLAEAGEAAQSLGRTGEAAAGAGGALDPARLAKAAQDLAPLREQAEAGKAVIDSAAQETAAKFGGVVRTAPVKSAARAAEKVVRCYRGNAREIKDLARNTVVVPPSQTDAVIDDIVTKMKVPATRIKRAAADEDPLGYSGAIINVQQPNGMLAEIQVNSPEMIFAKDAEADAERTLGPALFKTIKDATGMPGGRGHELYEKWRSLPPGSPDAAAIAAESKAYYAGIRARAARIDWKKALK